MNSIWNQMTHTWASGGWVMAALALLGIVLYSTAAHLLIRLYYRGITRASDADIKRWLDIPAKAPERVREIIRYTTDEARSMEDIAGRFKELETSRVTNFDRGIAFLNVVVISAPLFGLLGTVLGMLLTFKAIGVGGSATSDIIAKGISEALVATQTGMMVAIPGLMLANLAKRWRNEFVAFFARLESIALRHHRPVLHGMTRVFTRPATKAARVAAPVTASPTPEAVLS
jgi:biopolymer transport protein ExbB